MPKSKYFKPVIFWLFLCFIFLDTYANENIKTQKSTNIRLITLSPHLAELVVSAGALKNLVGVVSYSDFPEDVKSIQQVGDAFKLDYEAIVTLKPDYILTWKNGTSKDIIEKLKSFNLNVIETQIDRISDIPKVIQQIAQLTRTDKIANLNINEFNQKLNELKIQAHTERTLFIETYHQPLYTVSGKHWISEAVNICGYKNIFEDLSQLSAAVSLEAVITQNPQAILTIGEQEDKQWQKWQNLEAVKNNQIITIHPDFFSRPSMRILDGIKQLCEQTK